MVDLALWERESQQQEVFASQARLRADCYSTGSFQDKKHFHQNECSGAEREAGALWLWESLWHSVHKSCSICILWHIKTLCKSKWLISGSHQWSATVSCSVIRLFAGQGWTCQHDSQLGGKQASSDYCLGVAVLGCHGLLSGVSTKGEKDWRATLDMCDSAPRWYFSHSQRWWTKTSQFGKRMESWPKKLLAQPLNMKLMQGGPLSYLTDKVSQNEILQMRNAGIWVYTMVVVCVLLPYSTVLRSLYLRIWVLSSCLSVLPVASATNLTQIVSNSLNMSGPWSRLDFLIPVDLWEFSLLIQWLF